MSRVTNDIETVSATLNTSFIQVFSSLLTFNRHNDRNVLFKSNINGVNNVGYSRLCL